MIFESLQLLVSSFISVSSWLVSFFVFLLIASITFQVLVLIQENVEFYLDLKKDFKEEELSHIKKGRRVRFRSLSLENILNSERKVDSKKYIPSLECLLKVWKVPMEVALELDSFIQLVIRDFIRIWYDEVTDDKEFVESIEAILTNTMGDLSQRIEELDVFKLTQDIIIIVRRHLQWYREMRSRAASRNPKLFSDDINWNEDFLLRALRHLRSKETVPLATLREREKCILEEYRKEENLHPACEGDETDEKYETMEPTKIENDFLRMVSSLLIKEVLPKHALDCRPVRTLAREILSGSILGPVIGMIHPDSINFWITLAVEFDEENNEENSENKSRMRRKSQKLEEISNLLEAFVEKSDVKDDDDSVDEEDSSTSEENTSSEEEDERVDYHYDDDTVAPKKWVIPKNNSFYRMSIAKLLEKAETDESARQMLFRRFPFRGSDMKVIGLQHENPLVARVTSYRHRLHRGLGSQKKAKYVEFLIQVKCAMTGNQWKTYKRFRFFINLYDILKAESGDLKVKRPNKQILKSFFGTKGKSFQENRRQKLDSFLQELLASPHSHHSKYLRDFLSPETKNYHAKDGSNGLLGEAKTSEVKIHQAKNSSNNLVNDTSSNEILGRKMRAQSLKEMSPSKVKVNALKPLQKSATTGSLLHSKTNENLNTSHIAPGVARRFFDECWKLLQVLLDLEQQGFAARATVRSIKAMAITFLESSVYATVTEQFDNLVNAENSATLIGMVRDLLWVNDVWAEAEPPFNEKELKKYRELALLDLTQLVPSAAKKVLGEQAVFEACFKFILELLVRRFKRRREKLERKLLGAEVTDLWDLKIRKRQHHWTSIYGEEKAPASPAIVGCSAHSSSDDELDEEVEENKHNEVGTEEGKFSSTYETLAIGFVISILGIFSAAIAYGIEVGAARILQLRVVICDNFNTDYHRFISAVHASLLVIFAWFLTNTIAPKTAGSGIPEVKSILSGIYFHKFLSLRAMIVKTLSSTMLLGAGMYIGKEGPFIHISCAFANVLMRLNCFKSFRIGTAKWVHILSAACATGVAATFGSPFGGVLFSVEVTATYFFVNSVAPAFCSAILGTIVVDQLAQYLGNSSISLFQLRLLSDKRPATGEFFVFVSIGIICGLIAASSVVIVRFLVKMRSLVVPKHDEHRFLQLILCMSVAICVSILRHEVKAELGLEDGHFTDPNNNSIAADPAWNTDQKVLIHWLVNADSDVVQSAFLLKYVFLALAAIAFSITLPVPAGVFSPAFSCGAALGHVLVHFVIPHHWIVNYEIAEIVTITAAALAAGVTRTMSTAVIIMELAGSPQLHIPISIAVAASYMVASLFSCSIYDAFISSNFVPYMPSLPMDAAEEVASDIMTSIYELDEMPVIRDYCTIEDVFWILQNNPKRVSFPVTRSKSKTISSKTSPLMRNRKLSFSSPSQLSQSAERFESPIDYIKSCIGEGKLGETPGRDYQELSTNEKKEKMKKESHLLVGRVLRRDLIKTVIHSWRRIYHEYNELEETIDYNELEETIDLEMSNPCVETKIEVGMDKQHWGIPNPTAEEISEMNRVEKEEQRTRAPPIPLPISPPMKDHTGLSESNFFSLETSHKSSKERSLQWSDLAKVKIRFAASAMEAKVIEAYERRQVEGTPTTIFSIPTVLIVSDAAPLKVESCTTLARVHLLFTMLRLRELYICRGTRLVGEIRRQDLIVYGYRKKKGAKATQRRPGLGFAATSLGSALPGRNDFENWSRISSNLLQLSNFDPHVKVLHNSPSSFVMTWDNFLDEEDSYQTLVNFQDFLDKESNTPAPPDSTPPLSKRWCFTGESRPIIEQSFNITNVVRKIDVNPDDVDPDDTWCFSSSNITKQFDSAFADITGTALTIWKSNEEKEHLDDIDKIVTEKLGIDIAYGAPSQLLYYPPSGAFYKPHLDCGGNTSGSVHVDNERIFTVIIYLEDVKNGGETFFPNLNISVKPERGKALIWRSLDENFKCGNSTLHGSSPVMKGGRGKFAYQRWFTLHEARFEKMLEKAKQINVASDRTVVCESNPISCRDYYTVFKKDRENREPSLVSFVHEEVSKEEAERIAFSFSIDKELFDEAWSTFIGSNVELVSLSELMEGLQFIMKEKKEREKKRKEEKKQNKEIQFLERMIRGEDSKNVKNTKFSPMKTLKKVSQNVEYFSHLLNASITKTMVSIPFHELMRAFRQNRILVKQIRDAYLDDDPYFINFGSWDGRVAFYSAALLGMRTISYDHHCSISTMCYQLQKSLQLGHGSSDRLMFQCLEKKKIEIDKIHKASIVWLNDFYWQSSLVASTCKLLEEELLPGSLVATFRKDECKSDVEGDQFQFQLAVVGKTKLNVKIGNSESLKTVWFLELKI
eukprot:g4777.t1